MAHGVLLVKTRSLAEQLKAANRKNTALQAAAAVSAAKQRCLEDEIAALKASMDQVTVQNENYSIIAQAEQAFSEAGHVDTLLNLAKAVVKGHLATTSFYAQQLATAGRNLCCDSTKAWRFSEQEKAFTSLLYKVSRAAAELMRGPMNSQQLNTRDSVLTAKYNFIMCSRQTAITFDGRLSDQLHLQAIGFSACGVWAFLEMLGEHEEHDVDACFDATDTAESVVTSTSDQLVHWHGHHNIAEHVPIVDPHDQGPLLRQHQMLAKPLLMGLEKPSATTVIAVHDGLVDIGSFLAAQAQGSLQRLVSTLQSKRQKKATGFSIQAAEDARQDEDNFTAHPGLGVFSRAPCQALGKCEIDVKHAEADVQAAQKLADVLKCPALAAGSCLVPFFSVTLTVDPLADQVTLNLQPCPASALHQSFVMPLLTSTLVSLDTAFAALRQPANKLLVFRLQNLAHTHSMTIARFWVKHEQTVVIRPLLQYLLQQTTSISNRKLRVVFKSFDGAHTRQRDGLQQPTNVVQLAAMCQADLETWKKEMEQTAGRQGGKAARRKQLCLEKYKAEACPLPPSSHRRMAGAQLVSQSGHAACRLRHSQLLIHGELGTSMKAQLDSCHVGKRCSPEDCLTAHSTPCAAPEPPASSVTSVQEPSAPQHCPAEPEAPPALASTSMAPPAAVPSALTAEQHAAISSLLPIAGRHKKRMKLPKCGQCKTCKNPQQQKPCIFHLAVACMATEQAASTMAACRKEGSSVTSQQLHLIALLEASGLVNGQQAASASRPAVAAPNAESPARPDAAPSPAYPADAQDRHATYQFAYMEHEDIAEDLSFMPCKANEPPHPALVQDPLPSLEDIAAANNMHRLCLSMKWLRLSERANMGAAMYKQLYGQQAACSAHQSRITAAISTLDYGQAPNRGIKHIKSILGQPTTAAAKMEVPFSALLLLTKPCTWYMQLSMTPGCLWPCSLMLSMKPCMTGCV